MRFVALVVLTALVASGAASGCSSASPEGAGEDVVRMWIEPERVECTGAAPMECLQVAYTEAGPTELFYDPIVGFDFQEGTAYVIDVEVTAIDNPPADGSSLAYTLVEIVSEEPQ